jgi:hypothetical protein
VWGAEGVVMGDVFKDGLAALWRSPIWGWIWQR